MNNFLVSVFMLTYNQEEFIAGTIESVLMQRTNFDFQLVIGDDASTDSTSEICREFQKEYGERIKLLINDKNLGLIGNFIKTYEECDGKYVAILDGDDYWTDLYKLQKQADFLENNSEYSVVFTGFKKLFINGKMISKDYSNISLTTGFEDMIKKNYICSATVMFRNKKHTKDYPEWLHRFPYGDWPLYLWVTRNGEKIGFLTEETAVYRMEIGVSEKLKNVQSDIVRVNKKIISCVRKDENFEIYRSAIEESYVDHEFQLMGSLFREKKFNSSLKKGFSLVSAYPIKVIRTYLYLFKRIYLKKEV
jgi:glycosyltransferase involved in cell wall biosynthesis